MTKSNAHRSGSLKQSNKSHKTGRHRSKGAINSVSKGKINSKHSNKTVKKELGREVRRLQSKQIRQLKVDELKDLKRKLHNSLIPPHLISIIPLNENVDINPVISTITGASNVEVVHSDKSLIHISLPKFKQKYSIITAPIGNAFATLDIAKISSIIIFLVPATTDTKEPLDNQMIDDWGHEIIEQCISQGLPNVAVVLTNLKHIPIKKQHDVKKKLQDSISKWLPEEKVSVLDSETDAMNLLRRLGGQKPKLACFPDKRPHLLAEHFDYGYDENEFGILKVSGYLRGKPLSANSLVHIPGFGDYQMTQITAMKDPFSPDKDGQEHLVQKADPQVQESLDRENVPDPMDAEQTWPTAEELAEADAKNSNKKLVKLVPKGTSEYQAAWIPDVYEESDDESQKSDDDEMSVEGDKSDSESRMQDDEAGEEYEVLTTTSEVAPNEQKYDEQMDMMEERQMMEKIKEAKMDNMFPDEVDTPENILAKVRFQKYRGLESFRTSLWDPKENLPYDYSRIFQFENFDRTRRRVFKQSEDVQGAQPGKYVTLYIKGVSKELYDAHRSVEGRPMVVFGLLPNEQKMSLVNIILKRKNHPGMQPIKSKEKLIFQCGFRRFTASPIFSQHTNGSKHKYTRFFQDNDTIVASMFAPITYPPCPVLCYKKNKHNILDLVAVGSVMSVDPNRLVIKRVVLSGHPFKVNKRSAVIRFMFFHREDILWFKPVQLHTKYGRRGHIREPLGTHGHMKCVFDGQLKSQDTVLLNLYKRVFPKWTYEDYLITMQ